MIRHHTIVENFVCYPASRQSYTPINPNHLSNPVFGRRANCVGILNILYQPHVGSKVYTYTCMYTQHVCVRILCASARRECATPSRSARTLGASEEVQRVASFCARTSRFSSAMRRPQTPKRRDRRRRCRRQKSKPNKSFSRYTFSASPRARARVH